jgi:hypothetical protein
MKEEKHMNAEAEQISQDLQFVRSAVTKRERVKRMPSIIGVYWAAYILIGYPMLDFNSKAAGLFLMIAGILGGIFSGWIGKREALRQGERDAAQGRREAAHWYSLFIGIMAVIALGVIRNLPGDAVGQYVCLIVGMVYFLAGVHYERKFVWLGLLMMAGAVCISFVPHYPWTALGVVMSSGLLVAAFLNRRDTTHA